ncbi:MAG TPA: hypothetical protein VFA45_10535 [Actinomycetes bacterium]|nr:hypothetical protein [Actinomycetes bacterium]
MKIVEMFRFEDGRTVIVGHVRGGPPFIRQRPCELVIDGRVVQRLTLEGEMLPEKRISDDRRSVATFDDVQLTGEDLRSHDCSLRCT